MTSRDKETEELLIEAGNKIVEPPSSVEELIPLLDRIKSLLESVEQTPSKSMQNAITPSLKALVSDQLLKHSDIDVKVAVAACLSEITRITAPDQPYNDEQMEDVFHLIISSFENLSDMSSKSYGKRAFILATVAQVRSCVVMLDLECDGLIIEMFQHFLKTVRDYHPKIVFSAMETIMCLILEESDNISVELLSPILASVKKDNEAVLPIARKLGERVLDNCSKKLKPYLGHAVKTLGISIDDYNDVVASICKELSGSLEPNNLHNAGENVVEGTEVATPERVDVAIEKHNDSVKGNGIAQGGEDGSFSDTENKTEGEEHGSEECKEVKSSEISKPANLDSEKVEVEPSSPNVMDIESANVASSSQSGSLSDDGDSNEVEQTTKNDNSAIEVTYSADVSRKLSEGGMSVSDIKLDTNTEEKAPAEISDEINSAVDEDATELPGDHDEVEAVTSLKPTLRTTKKILGKTRKTSSKRKRTPGKQKFIRQLDKDNELHWYVRNFPYLNLFLLFIIICMLISTNIIMITLVVVRCGN